MSLNFPPGVENLTYTSDNGTLYVYQKGAWRVVSPAGEGGAQVIVSETAPDVTGLEEGTLWWDSKEGDLFVLYANENADGSIDMIWADATNHSNADDRDVIIGDQEPTNPDFIGQLWVNTSECPPTLNVWNGDCDGNGGEWVPIEGGGGSGGLIQLGVAIISSGKPDNYVGSTLTATGGEGIGTEGTIEPVYSWTRDGVPIASTRGAEVTADVEGTYEVTATVQDPNTAEVSTKTASIVINPFDVITFTPVITDDGTPDGNKVGHVLTASATLIEGGNRPTEYAFQWKSAGTNVGTAKTYTLESTDIGQEITCDVTVAESDGSGAVTETATYSKDVELLGNIVKPTILSPEDGAGSGGQRYLISDTIIEVEGGGIDVCETSLIEGVDDTTDAPNIILTFPDTQGFECFSDGDVVQGGKSPDQIITYRYSTSAIIDVVATASWSTFTNETSANVGESPINQGNVYAHMVDLGFTGRIDYYNTGSDAAFNMYASDTGEAGSWVRCTECGVIGNSTTPVVANKDSRYYLIHRVNVGSCDPSTGSTMATSGYYATVPIDQVHIISKDEDANTITVDGGDWSDGTDIVGDIIPVTDKGFLYDDPDIVAGDPSDVFEPGINSEFFLIRRDKAFLEFDFITPIEVASSVNLQAGAYNAKNDDGSYNFRVFINGTKFDNTDSASKLWKTLPQYSEIQNIPFTGQLTSLRIESVDAGDVDASLVVGGFGEGVGAQNLFVDGSTKIVGTVVQEKPGQRKLTKETAYDTKLTVDSDKDLADMTGATFMSDGSGAPGPYTQTPYKLVTSEITNVDEVVNDFQGLISDWQLVDILTAAHYPSSNGPFESVDNNYAYFYDTSSQVPISNRTTARAYIDLLEVAEGSDIEVAWQGSRGNYASTILQLLDKDGNVVLQTGFNNPTRQPISCK